MKKLFCSVTAIALSVVLTFGLSGCKKSEPFACDGCGRTVTDGAKHTVTDSYGDKYNYCDDCFDQIRAFAAQ